MANLAVDQQYVASLATQFATLNSNAYANYQNTFQNYLLDLTSAGPGAVPPVEPTPPQLIVLNTTLALQLVVAWDTAWGTLAPGAPAPVLNLTPAISYVTAAAITPPAPPVTPAPNDPVGPPQGVNNAAGQPMFYTVAGDTLPNGAVFTDTRGTFVKVIVQTPFGGEAYWEKVS
jgi:hypothetical protein